MFFRRTARADRWTSARVALFTVGAGLAVTGMLLEHDWIIAAAAVILLAGIALRFLGPGEEGDHDG